MGQNSPSLTATGLAEFRSGQKKWQTEHRTATTAYPCYLPVLGEFSRSWSCRFAGAKISASGDFWVECPAIKRPMATKMPRPGADDFVRVKSGLHIQAPEILFLRPFSWHCNCHCPRLTSGDDQELFPYHLQKYCPP
jgi:hypothetical protein